MTGPQLDRYFKANGNRNTEATYAMQNDVPHQIRTHFQPDQLEEEMLRQNGGVHGYSLIKLQQRSNKIKTSKTSRHDLSQTEKKTTEMTANHLDIDYARTRNQLGQPERKDSADNLNVPHDNQERPQTTIHIYFKKLQFNFNFKLSYKVY